MAPPFRSLALPRRLAAVSVALGAGIIFWMLVIHVRMVISPAPQEMREGAVPWITQLLLEGRNPYALEELPAGTDVYGILYHLLVIPLALLFGNSFAIHRIVSALAIVASCWLTYLVLRREGSDRLLASIGAMLCYAASVYFTGPLARPDGVAVLLSMASLTVLTMHRRGGQGLTSPSLPSNAALAWGLVFGLLALLTKISLAFPPFVVAAHLFLFGPRASRIRGLAYGAITCASAIGLMALMNLLYPAYVTLTFAANAQSGFSDGQHLMRQTFDFLVFSLPVTIALVISVGAWLLHRNDRAGGGLILRPNLFVFGAAANAALFFIWLGWHPGAHMTYLFQLVLPLLMPAVLPRIARLAWPRAIVAIALPVGLVLAAPYFTWSFERFRTAEATFAELDRIIRSHSSVLGSTEVAGLLALAGHPVVDSGQSEYFSEAIGRRTLPGTIPREQLRDRWKAMFGAMEDTLHRGGFDLVIRSRRAGLIPLRIVAEHYRRAETISITFAWCGQTWLLDLWAPTP